jgi:hypothetical protein
MRFRESGAPALRSGPADAAGPARGRRHRAVRRRAVPETRCGVGDALNPLVAAAHGIRSGVSPIGCGSRSSRAGRRRSRTGPPPMLRLAELQRSSTPTGDGSRRTTEGAPRHARGPGLRRFASGCSTSRCPERSARRLVADGERDGRAARRVYAIVDPPFGEWIAGLESAETTTEPPGARAPAGGSSAGIGTAVTRRRE